MKRIINLGYKSLCMPTSYLHYWLRSPLRTIFTGTISLLGKTPFGNFKYFGIFKNPITPKFIINYKATAMISAKETVLEEHEEVMAKDMETDLMEVLDETAEDLGFFSSIWKHGWKPTSEELFSTIENTLLKKTLKTEYRQEFVTAGGYQFNTIVLGSGPPLVMLHGYGGGIGIWIDNLDEISAHYTIYAIDILGFGRSSRPTFKGKSAEEAEEWFVNGVELWRSAVKLDNFYLLGHSMGAFISTCYTIKYPEKVQKLILADPWGVPEKTPDVDAKLDWKWKFLTKTLPTIIPSPFSIVRALGPYGPSIIQKVRSDLPEKFKHVVQDTSIITKYIYHCNAQEPSGELAFAELQIPIGWSKRPLVHRFKDIPSSIPVVAVYGQHSWMNPRRGYYALLNVPGRMDFIVIPEAGHHIYIDDAPYFNKVVILAKEGIFDKVKGELSVHTKPSNAAKE